MATPVCELIFIIENMVNTDKQGIVSYHILPQVEHTKNKGRKKREGKKQPHTNLHIKHN